jgi:hypothetical protein
VEDLVPIGSNFGPADKDKFYTNLPKRNVMNTNIGYDLYESGHIVAKPPP